MVTKFVLFSKPSVRQGWVFGAGNGKNLKKKLVSKLSVLLSVEIGPSVEK